MCVTGLLVCSHCCGFLDSLVMKPTQQIWTVNSLILVLIVVSSTGLSALAADVYVSLSPGLGYSAVDCGKNVSHPCNSIQTAVNLPTTRDGDVLWLLNNGVCREMNVTVDKSVTIAAYNGTITWQCSSADGNMTRKALCVSRNIDSYRCPCRGSNCINVLELDRHRVPRLLRMQFYSFYLLNLFNS